MTRPRTAPLRSDRSRLRRLAALREFPDIRFAFLPTAAPSAKSSTQFLALRPIVETHRGPPIINEIKKAGAIRLSDRPRGPLSPPTRPA